MKSFNEFKKDHINEAPSKAAQLIHGPDINPDIEKIYKQFMEIQLNLSPTVGKVGRALVQKLGNPAKVALLKIKEPLDHCEFAFDDVVKDYRMSLANESISEETLGEAALYSPEGLSNLPGGKLETFFVDLSDLFMAKFDNDPKLTAEKQFGLELMKLSKLARKVN